MMTEIHANEENESAGVDAGIITVEEDDDTVDSKKVVTEEITERDEGSEVEEVEVKIVWEPPWDKTKMSESAKLELNL